ncbi:[protein-PII] uridylyltransferase [Rodentibacter pneumotropicus]|uniref:Bifunctional uridylyltransferase/uridylyl-removing enzyme n=1 Tax=Rodentibacter pneumotropicus TaxID=758 RepID=A0A448MRG1_9PAST|nr:[protein-PII] uridylyltransferase [Rodentibacter pneumotropicus]
MMKQFFQSLQRISLISNLLIQHYREHFLSPHYDVFIHQLDDNFELINERLCLRKPNLFFEQPERILDLFFYLTQFEQATVHSETLRKLRLALEQLPQKLCEIPAAREKFLRLFNQKNAISRAFVPMHQYGVLTAYLPQWQEIEGLMQFDLFHIYTVDEHTLRVMLKLESFLLEENASEHPICHRLFSQFSDRTLLYIAALFHDIAKGRGGDHAELGAIDVAEFAQLHGLDRREIDTLSWLVKAHLLMSITAQRRDIYDPEIVMKFAEEVQNQVRLDYLTCLTVADICATNSTLWNTWKRSLFLLCIILLNSNLIKAWWNYWITRKNRKKTAACRGKFCSPHCLLFPRKPSGNYGDVALTSISCVIRLNKLRDIRHCWWISQETC